MTSVCSEKKLKNLLLEITDIKSDMSWQKVASWTKAVVASLRRLKVDYSSFPDVVTPFSTGLTLVRTNRFSPIYHYCILLCLP